MQEGTPPALVQLPSPPPHKSSLGVFSLGVEIFGKFWPTREAAREALRGDGVLRLRLGGEGGKKTIETRAGRQVSDVSHRLGPFSV